MVENNRKKVAIFLDNHKLKSFHTLVHQQLTFFLVDFIDLGIQRLNENYR